VVFRKSFPAGLETIRDEVATVWASVEHPKLISEQLGHAA
jgi:hypothetical protein